MTSARNRRPDPYLACNFRLQITGIVVGGFTEVSGLQSEVEVKEYREGGNNMFVHRLVGPPKPTRNLILKHGLIDVVRGSALWDWYQQVLTGNIQRHNISVLLLNTQAETVRQWDFAAAVPVVWKGSDLNASNTTVAIETLEFAHRGFAPTSRKRQSAQPVA